MKQLAADGVRRWQEIFAERFRPILERYPTRLDVDVEELADTLTSVIEGGIVVSRVMGDPRILAQQLLQFRNYVRLLFEAAQR